MQREVSLFCSPVLVNYQVLINEPSSCIFPFMNHALNNCDLVRILLELQNLLQTEKKKTTSHKFIVLYCCPLSSDLSVGWKSNLPCLCTLCFSEYFATVS